MGVYIVYGSMLNHALLYTAITDIRCPLYNIPLWLMYRHSRFFYIITLQLIYQPLGPTNTTPKAEILPASRFILSLQVNIPCEFNIYRATC